MLHYLEFRAMGCQATVQLEAEADAGPLISRIPATIEAIEAQLSRFRLDSDLMRLNALAGRWTTVSPTLFENIYSAWQMAQHTDGLYNPLVLPALIAVGYDRPYEQISHAQSLPLPPVFDGREIALRPETREVCIPMGSALDLGGLAKGWTTERMADELRPYGACLLNIGGDMTARGAPTGLPGWEVEIEDPITGQAFATLWLRDTSIATSGTDYRRWTTMDGRNQHHLIDPRTGQPAETDALTATVVHAQAVNAEAYTKAVLLRGAADGLNWLNHQYESAGIVFQQDGTVLATSTLTSLIDERNTSL